MKIIFKKIILNCLLLFGAVSTVFSQEIHNIKAEQFQSEMFITYDILNALPSQMFLVKVDCIIDNHTHNVVSASGNGIGRVNAGPSKQIIWELSKDLKPVKSDNVKFKIYAIPISKPDEGGNHTESVSRGMSISDRKFQFMSLFTSSVDNYLEQIGNLVITIKTFGDRAFESRNDLKRIQDQVDKLNVVYEELQPKKEGIKQNIRSFWGSEAINCTSETFLNKILDEMHNSQIITLNGLVKDINDVLYDTKLKSSEREKKIQKIKLEIQIRSEILAPEVVDAKRRATALYQSLK